MSDDLETQVSEILAGCSVETLATFLSKRSKRTAAWLETKTGRAFEGFVIPGLRIFAQSMRGAFP